MLGCNVSRGAAALGIRSMRRRHVLRGLYEKDVTGMSIEILDGRVSGARDPDETVRRLRAGLDDYHRGRARQAGWTRQFVPTGLAPLDAVLPGGGLPGGAIADILYDGEGAGSMALAMRIAGSDTNIHRLRADHSETSLQKPKRDFDGQPSKNPPQSPFGKGGRRQDDLSGDDTIAPFKTDNLILPDVQFLHQQDTGAAQEQSHAVVVVDTRGDFYPPAACPLGVGFHRLIVIRPANEQDAFWAVDQALHCPGVAMVIAPLSQLDTRQSRRLQLAAESSGCIGLIVRPARRRSKSFAAIQILVDSVEVEACMEHDGVRLCRITLIKVREGTPGASALVDLHHETGLGPVHPIPVDRPADRRFAVTG